MKTIMLACSAGMSTSMLVTKMRAAAKEKGIEADIFAVSVGSVEHHVEEKPIDVILLGPQVRFQESAFKEKYEPRGIPVAVINMQDYGMMRGDNVLDEALRLID